MRRDPQREPVIADVREQFADLERNLEELERADAPEGLVTAFRKLLRDFDALCELHNRTRQQGLADIERRWASLLNEQKETREELRRETHFIERLVETARAIVVVLDTTGRITFFNPYMEEVSGYSLEEVRGKDWFTLFLPVREHARLHALFERAVGDMEVRGNVNAILTKAGTELEVEWYAKTLKDADGGVIGLISVGQDITERKEAEHELRRSEAMLRRAQEIARVGSSSAEGPSARENVRWSDEMFRITGRDPQSGPLPFADVVEQSVHPDDRGAVRSAHAKALSERQMLDVEFRFQRPNGSIRYIHNVAGPNVDGEGRPLRWISSWHDITEQKKLEASYRQAQKMEAVGTLTSGIAHDYNNLLMGVLGCLDVALKKPDLEAARPFLEGARDATRRGGALTRQLLTFSQRRETKPSEINVSELIQQADKMMRSLLGESIELRIALGRRGWLTEMDPGQLEQVIMNLVVNARDAMPEGGVLTVESGEVALTASEGSATGVLEEGDYVTVSVHDTGVGMNAETQERVFEPFFSTKGIGKGSGLGLSTVYGIVTGSGGQIQVSSQLGVGTEFTIFLPRIASSGETLRPPATQEEGRLGSEVVLIVEDEPLVRLAVRGYLEPSGYRVLEACDAAEASLIFQRTESPIELLITDAMLPGVSGRQVAEELAALRPSLRVLFMSAHPAETLYEMGRVPEGALTLQKPFTQPELMQMLRAVLGEGSQPFGDPRTKNLGSHPSHSR